MNNVTKLQRSAEVVKEYYETILDCVEGRQPWEAMSKTVASDLSVYESYSSPIKSCIRGGVYGLRKGMLEILESPLGKMPIEHLFDTYADDAVVSRVNFIADDGSKIKALEIHRIENEKIISSSAMFFDTDQVKKIYFGD